jgi:hypothetical protein
MPSNNCVIQLDAPSENYCQPNAKSERYIINHQSAYASRICVTAALCQKFHPVFESTVNQLVRANRKFVEKIANESLAGGVQTRFLGIKYGLEDRINDPENFGCSQVLPNSH